jgi:hypothetical protein
MPSGLNTISEWSFGSNPQSQNVSRVLRWIHCPLGPQRVAWASAVSELILSPAERAMLPVLDLDPAIVLTCCGRCFRGLWKPALQAHLADVSEDHRSAAGQSGVVEADGALLGLPDQLQEPPPVVDQRQIVATKLQQIKGERHRIAAPALAARRHESPALPSSPIVSTSPSIRHDAVLRRRAASTWQGSGRLVFCDEKHPLGLCLRTLLDRGLNISL